MAMSDDTWDELAVLTARLETISSDRTVARRIGNAQLREQLHAQILDLRNRRDRLIDRLSGHHSQAGRPPRNRAEATLSGVFA
jgi:hypothetical protein